MNKPSASRAPTTSAACLGGFVAAGMILAGCAAPTPPSAPPTPDIETSPSPTPTRAPTITPTPSATPGPGLGELLMTPNALAAVARLDAAEDAYRDLATLYPSKAEPLLGLAAIAQREGDPEAANRYFEAAIAAEPDNQEALRLWAIFLEAEGDFEGVARALDQMAALAPDDADLRVARAMAVARLGDSQAAIADLEAAMALDPRREYAWLNVAGAASGARQYQAAIEIATAGLDAHPNSAGLLMTRGLAYLSLNDAESAIANFDAVSALDPSHAAALHWKGRALMSLERYPQAAETLKLAADLGEVSGVDGVNLSYESMAYAADALARADVQAAFEYLAGKVVKHGSRDGLLMGYGLARWRQGNIQLATGRMDSLIENGFVPALYWRGVILAEQREQAKAASDLMEFISLRRSGPDAESARRLLESMGYELDK